MARLDEVCPQAGERLAGFEHWVNHEQLSRVQEIYTSTFDLQGLCCPYVGYQLFGESYQRSWFMARLNEGYRQKGYDCGSELPDHVVMVLRFLSASLEDEFSLVLLQEGLLPAAGKMIEVFGENRTQPYCLILQALLLLLQEKEISGAFSLAHPGAGGVGDD